MQDHPQYQQQKPPSNGLGVAGFVISLLGLLGTCGLLSPIGLILSLFALRKEPRGLAIAGSIIGFIGSIWILLFVIFFGIMIVAGAGLAAAGIALTVPNIQTYATMTLLQEEIGDYYSTLDALPESIDGISGQNPELADDAWGNAIVYEIVDDDSYRLVSLGMDGARGTDDDIVLDTDMGQ